MLTVYYFDTSTNTVFFSDIENYVIVSDISFFISNLLSENTTNTYVESNLNQATYK